MIVDSFCYRQVPSYPTRTYRHSSTNYRRDVYCAFMGVIRRELLKADDYIPSEDRWRAELEWFGDLKRHAASCFPSPFARRLFAAAGKLEEFHDVCEQSRSAMVYAQFYDSVFEVIDMWVPTADAEEYAAMGE